MLKKSNGFTLIEVLVSFSILMFVMTALVPTLLFVFQEKQEVENRRVATALLHTTLQSYLYDSANLEEREELVKGKKFDIHLTKLDTKLVEVCITWEAKRGDGKKCLLGKKYE